LTYQNAVRNSGKQNALIELEKTLPSVITGLRKDDKEQFKQFSDNPAFKRWLADTIFSATYDRPASAAS
jgi:type I restriction enzyme R subunit